MRVRAKSQSGSVHWVTGTVENGQGVPWTSAAQAEAELVKRGWSVVQVIHLTQHHQDQVPEETSS